MRPVNLFAVSRIRDEKQFNIATKHEAADRDNHITRIHEIKSLRILVDALMSAGTTVAETDGFYFGYTIPHIGKEFDLLKVAGKHCLNIELKSQDVTTEQILAQLIKNRHYLTHLDKRLTLFTVVTDTMTCYRLSKKNKLVPATVEEIVSALKRCNVPYDADIGRSFSASEYLISPVNDPGKFIQHQYFLTPAQDYVKTELLKGIAECDSGSFFLITGRPGTGKTLLLYDLARTLSDRSRTLIVHLGRISDGEVIISNVIENLEITTADQVGDSYDISNYDYILVDESHRLGEEEFNTIVKTVRENGRICIFSSDPESILTFSEKQRDITGRIRDLDLSGEYMLSERLRMNMELYTFIMTLKHLSYTSNRTYEYNDVSINYANDIYEAVRLIGYFRDKGYIFINARIPGADDPFADLAEEFDERHLIGCEYDKVVMLMDNSFYYDEDGFLKGIPHPRPDYIYPNLFYQGITRVREKLALVILDAPDLLRSILEIIR